MTKWHLTPIFCFSYWGGRKKKKKKKKKGIQAFEWKLAVPCLAAGRVWHWRRQGQGRGLVSWQCVFPVERVGTSIFIVLCTFHSGGNLIGTRFVYWSTLPVSPSGNVKAGSLPFLVLARRPRPHLPFLGGWHYPLDPCEVPLWPLKSPCWVLLAR